jgi:integrase
MIGKLFEAARGTRAYPFIVLAACSAARRGELCALKWADVDFAKRTLSISKSVEQTRNAPLRIKGIKSGEGRHIGIDDFALEVLTEHREEQERDKSRFGSDYRTMGLCVLPAKTGDSTRPVKWVRE